MSERRKRKKMKARATRRRISHWLRGRLGLSSINKHTRDCGLLEVLALRILTSSRSVEPITKSPPYGLATRVTTRVQGTCKVLGIHETVALVATPESNSGAESEPHSNGAKHPVHIRGESREFIQHRPTNNYNTYNNIYEVTSASPASSYLLSSALVSSQLRGCPFARLSLSALPNHSQLAFHVPASLEDPIPRPRPWRNREWSRRRAGTSIAFHQKPHFFLFGKFFSVPSYQF
jgi:hypothetical protein